MFLIGSEVSLTILGVVSYHRGGGVMVDAVSDSYDEKTRVKSTTIKLTSLDKPVMIHIEGSMGDVRLSFSPDAAEDTDTPPYFALVEVTLPDFEDAEVFGNTFDLFATELSAATGESVWLNTYGGSSNERLNGVTATSVGGFIMVDDAKSGDGTFVASAIGYDNSYVMKLDAAGNVAWVSALKSSEYNEAERVIELADRYIVLGNSNSTDFDFKDLNKGSSDVYVAQFDKQGNRLALDVIGGSAGDYAAQITAVNDYQVNVFMYDESTDGDFAKRPQGGNDAMLLTYDWREKPVDTSALEAAIE